MLLPELCTPAAMQQMLMNWTRLRGGRYEVGGTAVIFNLAIRTAGLYLAGDKTSFFRDEICRWMKIWEDIKLLGFIDILKNASEICSNYRQIFMISKNYYL